MNKEDLILRKLEALEATVAPMVESHRMKAELMADLAPMGRQAMENVVKGLQEVETGFRIADAADLLKGVVRNTKNFTYALGQFESLMDFLKDLEPLLKLTVPKLISHLDDLERRGVFRILKIWVVDFREKIAENYGPEETEEIVDGMVALIGLVRGLSDPKAVALLHQLAEVPAKVEIGNAKPVGPVGMVSSLRDAEVRQGLGVLMELARGMGRISKPA